MNTIHETPVQEVAVTTDLRRPNHICSQVKQEVIVLRDASPSMDGDKARQAQAACEEMTDTLAQPINKGGFVMAVADFNDKAYLAHDWELVTDLAGHIKPLRLSSTTNMTDALRLANEMLDTHRRDSSVKYLRPVVLVFSDGRHNTGESPINEANRLKAKADVVCVAFGDDADETLLMSIASTSQHFYRVQNGAELRHFMAAVGDTLTITMAQKRDATQALTKVMPK